MISFICSLAILAAVVSKVEAQEASPSLGPVPETPTTTDGWCIIVGADLDGSNDMPGYDLDLPGQLVDAAEECLDICEFVEDCDAVTYVASTSKCYLKDLPDVEGIRPVDSGFGTARILSLIGDACPCNLPEDVLVFSNATTPCFPPFSPIGPGPAPPPHLSTPAILCTPTSDLSPGASAYE